eukprot:GHVL01023286.1.p2 GENE.GHVL01023286.1~~GHVL01023286.1.p2  ORF type:complete len:110 (+),score=9.67 GHVL01023286.1:37-366(+)
MNVLMVGTGEYTTGLINDGDQSQSDKKKGVVALVLIDLKRRGFVSKLGMVGVNGKKFPLIREHLKNSIKNCYKDMDTHFETWPSDSCDCDPYAYKRCLFFCKSISFYAE